MKYFLHTHLFIMNGNCKNNKQNEILTVKLLTKLYFIA